MQNCHFLGTFNLPLYYCSPSRLFFSSLLLSLTMFVSFSMELQSVFPIDTGEVTEAQFAKHSPRFAWNSLCPRVGHCPRRLPLAPTHPAISTQKLCDAKVFYFPTLFTPDQVSIHKNRFLASPTWKRLSICAQQKKKSLQLQIIYVSCYITAVQLSPSNSDNS